MDRRILKIIDILEKEYPDAGTRLHFSSVFELVIAVVLSAQSTDEQVNRVTAKLFEKYPAPADFYEAGLEELEKDIRAVGLYKNKAKNIKKLAGMLVEKYQSQVPDDFDRLLELPGVGRKTANVIMAVGFNQPGLGVDTHVTRVANRLGLVATPKPDLIEMRLKELIPIDKWSISHHLLIFHGRRICRARNPLCHQCVLVDYCPKLID